MRGLIPVPRYPVKDEAAITPMRPQRNNGSGTDRYGPLPIPQSRDLQMPCSLPIVA